ncbi:MAG: hypothetical protein LQ337_007058 [Flavoplaca oasis]|nr:MAG: hypothetical protein LQ337_007058 [Flavoplaca oasis]
MTYSQRLFHHTYASQRENAHFIEFRLLQRLNLVQLENELAQLKGKVWSHMDASDQDMKLLRATLRDYATAIRDFEYLRRMKNITLPDERLADLRQAFPEIADLPGDPYNSRYCTTFEQLPHSNDPLRNFLKDVLPRQLTYTKAEIAYRTDEYLSGVSPESISPSVDRLARFVLGVVGGAAPVVPMLIMSINSTQAKSLTTTSVAVVLFAIAMAAGIRATNAETLAATAAYAAVVVVFVGTSGS